MTDTSSGVSNSSPTLTESGLVSGLNTTAIISALMAPYNQQINTLDADQSKLNGQAGDYTTIQTDLVALQNAADALNLNSSGWNDMSATSSNSSVATATAEPGTAASTVDFTVQGLAQGNVQTSTDAVASTSTVITAAASLLLSEASQLGFAGLGDGGGLALGSHTIDVTQASESAVTTGSTAVAANTVISTGANDTINLAANGTPYTLTLAPSGPGGYTPAQLVSAINAAAAAAGAPVSAAVNGQGDLVLGTNEQDAAASLQVTGGDALGATTGLAVMGSAVNGTDAVVDVDGQSNALTSITPGGTATLTSGTGGTIDATFSTTDSPNASLVAVGSTTAQDVSTGNGSLSNVVNAINAAGAGMTANTIDTTNGYVLQLASTSTGATSQVTVDPNAFASTLGALVTTQVGQDAEVYLDGNPNYAVTSATNAFTGLLPGLTVNVLSTSSSPVSVTTAADGSTVAGLVQTMVTAANQALSDIATDTAYNPSTEVAGPLNGSLELSQLQQSILGIFSSTGGSSNLGNGLAAGVTVNANGTVSFNQQTFLSEFAAHPTETTDLFTQGGTLSPSAPQYANTVALSYAGQTTLTGSYDITLTQSATQATDNGSVLAGGTVGTAETLTVQQGATNASYTTTNGETLADVAAGLNAAFAGAGLDLSAQVVNSGDQLQITTAGYGSGETFSMESTDTGAGTTGLAGAINNTFTPFTGQDVAGTINGTACTGSGQFLTAPGTDPTLDGLSLLVTTTGISSSTSIGTFAVQPGLAQALSTNSYNWSNPLTGTLTSLINSLTSQATGMNTQITQYQQTAAAEQKSLQLQYAQMEVTLGKLKQQGFALDAGLGLSSGSSSSNSSNNTNSTS